MDISENILFREEEFGGILYVKDANAFLQINKDALKLLNLIDQGFSKKEILNKTEIQKEDLKEFLATLKRLNGLKQ